LPIGFIATESALEVIADRVSLCRSLYVDSPAPALTFAPPEKVCMNYSTTAVAAALAVIRVRRTKFDSDPPLALAVIAHPSVLPFGNPHLVFDPDSPSLARL
jgi:hypothetical protein